MPSRWSRRGQAFVLILLKNPPFDFSIDVKKRCCYERHVADREMFTGYGATTKRSGSFLASSGTQCRCSHLEGEQI